MSDDATFDPLETLPADAGEDTTRQHLATLVRGGACNVGAANSALVSKGFAELNENSQEYFSARKQALLNDTNWTARYLAGDPAAVSDLYRLDLGLINSKGDLLDRVTPSPNDPAYDAVRREVGNHFSDVAAYNTYSGEITGLVSSIGMPAENARSLTEDHFAAVRETAGMTPDEAKLWGDRETASLEASIGEGAAAKLAEASKVLSAKSGRKLDLSSIVKTNGARVAINLYFTAQSLTLTTRK